MQLRLDARVRVLRVALTGAHLRVLCTRCPSPQPHRVRMAHELIMSYDLYQQMEVFVRSPTWRGSWVPALAW